MFAGQDSAPPHPPHAAAGGDAVPCSRTRQRGAGSEEEREESAGRREDVGQLVCIRFIQSGYNRLFLPFIFGPLDLICS